MKLKHFFFSLTQYATTAVSKVFCIILIFHGTEHHCVIHMHFVVRKLLSKIKDSATCRHSFASAQYTKSPLLLSIPLKWSINAQPMQRSIVEPILPANQHLHFSRFQAL